MGYPTASWLDTGADVSPFLNTGAKKPKKPGWQGMLPTRPGTAFNPNLQATPRDQAVLGGMNVNAGGLSRYPAPVLAPTLLPVPQRDGQYPIPALPQQWPASPMDAPDSFGGRPMGGGSLSSNPFGQQANTPALASWNQRIGERQTAFNNAIKPGETPEGPANAPAPGSERAAWQTVNDQANARYGRATAMEGKYDPYSVQHAAQPNLGPIPQGPRPDWMLTPAEKQQKVNDAVANTMQEGEWRRRIEGTSAGFTNPNPQPFNVGKDGALDTGTDMRSKYMEAALNAQEAARRGDVVGYTNASPGAWQGKQHSPGDLTDTQKAQGMTVNQYGQLADRTGRPASTTAMLNATPVPSTAWGLQRQYAALGQQVPATLGQTISDRAAWMQPKYRPIDERQAMVESNAAWRQGLGQEPLTGAQAHVQAKSARGEPLNSAELAAAGYNPLNGADIQQTQRDIAYGMREMELQRRIDHEAAIVYQKRIAAGDTEEAAQALSDAYRMQRGGNRAALNQPLPPVSNRMATPPGLSDTPEAVGTPDTFDPKKHYTQGQSLKSFVDSVSNKYPTLTPEQQKQLQAFISDTSRWSPKEMAAFRNGISQPGTGFYDPDYYNRIYGTLGWPKKQTPEWKLGPHEYGIAGMGVS